MITYEQIADLINADGQVRTEDGDLGSIERIFVDDATGQPSWILVGTGAPGNATALVPLSGAAVDGRELRVPYEKALVEGSPRMSDVESLSTDQEEQLLRHYGLKMPAAVQNAQAGSGASGPGMTRSEERLRVGTETRESGKVRIHKYIVTETVTQTIPVRREEIRIEHLPVGDAGEAIAAAPGVERIGTPFDEGEYEIVLYEERAVIELETVPVERITLTKETITEAETVSGEVRKEVIEATELT
ncbi:uncharacterized protein (TIGR02271 family) [Arthrobacter sp. CAN_A214]|uniref:YsnF/AvaK domain-containing protein n=1 Tax=Arthrobacter sp. CAN_A214 TaxID=2787720 RepID=UPI0018CB5DA1